MVSSLVDLLAGAARLPARARSAYATAPHRAAELHRRLAATLRAARRIPFYAERLPPSASPADLPGLPTLERNQLPELAGSARSRIDDRRGISTAESSGSTGEPVEFLFDAAHERGRFAARMRYLWMHGWRPLERSAWLIALMPGSHDGDLSNRRRLAGARFFPHIVDFEAQADWLRRFDPRWLYSMPSNLEALVETFERRGQRLAALRKIFCGGEVLEEAIRERVRRVLGVEIAENYGSTEAFLAFECPQGGMHVNAEHVLVEVVDQAGRAVAPGEIGRVLVTTLENQVMPLVRYEIGDHAIAADADPCPCGRSLPRLGKIQGRTINLFRHRDGRLFSPWRLLDKLREIPGVHRLQLAQTAAGAFEVRFVSDAGLPADAEARMREQLLAAIGEPATFTFRAVAAIPYTRTGKFFSAVYEVDAAGELWAGADPRSVPTARS